MKLIVGLGNPGGIYTNSRHNIGFKVVRALAKARNLTLKKDSGAPALSAKFKIDKQSVVLAMPLVFMNLSGLAVSGLLKKYKIDLYDLLVVCDDLDLEFGRLKIKQEGSSGGHRGLESIISSLGKKNFNRLRIGIDRPRPRLETAEYVLSGFTRQEKERLLETIDKAVDCCLAWVSEGITKSMNIFNPCQRKERRIR